MTKKLHDLLAPAQRVISLPEVDADEIRQQILLRSVRDMARRSLPGAFPYMIMFVILVAVTGLADQERASIIVLGAGLTAFTALRILRCRAESQLGHDGRTPSRSLLTWVVMGQAIVWTYFSCFVIVTYGMQWQSLLVMLCTAATVTGGLFSFAPDLRLSRIYAMIMILPVAGTLLVEGSTAASATAFVILLYGVIVSQMTRVQNQEYWRSLEANELLRRHAEALTIARREAEQASRAKSTFLANISHELRTPLHGILSYARFGVSRVGRVDDAKLVEYFERIESSGNGLLVLFDDLLDLSRLEAGRMTCHPEVQRLAPVLQSVADEFRGRCLENGIELEIVVSEPGCTAAIDPIRFKQVMRNLLSNAVRYAPDSSTLRVRQSSHDDVLRVEVEDEGPGVPESELDQIFEKFVQSSATDSGAGGTGLGLTISRQLMVLQNGSLWAENRAEGGARFIAELPRVEALHAPKEEPATVEV